MRIEELEKRIYSLNGSIKEVLRASQYEKYGDLSGVDYSPEDPEENFIATELEGVLEKLDRIEGTLEYLQRPIEATGKLFKNERERYTARPTETAPDSFIEEWEYTSGQGIEFLYSDPFEERASWRASRVEHNGKDYYIVGYPDIQLEGLTVRRRERA